MAKATIKELKGYFEADGGPKVSMQELKELKQSNDGQDYNQIAEGIGDGTETY
jgi:hypothetical protein